MVKNVIILGAGRTGSSLLAGLIAHNRYWINQESIESRAGYPDGDYENPSLVKLNKDILTESGYGYTKVVSDCKVDITAIKKLVYADNIYKYKAFIQKCEENSPWLWKDPRLCYTIYFWQSLLELDNIDFLFITRNRYDIFRSYTKYQIYTTKTEVYRKYDEQITAVEAFLEENKVPCLKIHYPELKRKEELISKLNNYLGTSITIADYKAVERTGMRPNETELAFWLRYYWGVCKLKIGKNYEERRSSE